MTIESTSSATSEETVTYVRRLGVWDASMVVVGGIIGAGIFLNPKYVAQRTGSSEAVIVAWLIGGALALIGALCYAELGTRRPQAGGGYVYLREAWGPMLAFLYGWILLTVDYSGGIAAVAETFGVYFCATFDLSLRLAQPLAVGAIVLLTGISYFGIKAGAIVQNIFTVLKLMAIALLVITGLALATPHSAVIAAAKPIHISVWNFGAILMPVMFSYGGWAWVNNIAGEIREPRRNMPRALVVGIGLVVACYVLSNLAYLNVLGHDGLATSAAPAAAVMRTHFGDIGARLIAAGIAISTFGFCNIAIIASARVFQVMSADGLFFRPVAHLHPRYRSPDIALFVFSGWAIVLALTGTYGQLLNYATVGDWLGYAGVVATLYFYRRKRDTDENIFRAPGYPWFPAIFIIAVLLVVASNVVSNPGDAGMGVAIILLGLPVYWFWSRRRVAVTSK